MSNRELYNSFGRYMTANAVIGGAAAELKAEEICTVMKIDLMTPEELKMYHEEKEAEEREEELMENLGLAFRGVLIIGMLILMFYLSYQ